MAREEEQRQFDARLAAQEAASRRASSGGGGGGFSGLSLNAAPVVPTQQQQQVAPKASGYDFSGLVSQNNPYVFRDLLVDVNRSQFGGKASYGQMARWLEGNIGKIPNGSAADIALRNIFLKTEIDPNRRALIGVNKAIGR